MKNISDVIIMLLLSLGAIISFSAGIYILIQTKKRGLKIHKNSNKTYHQTSAV